MNILVTGGAGFIGHHLVKRLIEHGHRVYVVDDFTTGHPDNLVEGAIVKTVCVTERRFLESFRYKPIECVYHLACPASPVHYQSDPVKTLRTCFEGTRNVLELAHGWQSRVLLASTSEVYGDPTEHPQTESYWGNVNPCGPRSCYDEGKRVAEALAYAYRLRGVDVRIARIFNTYGPKMAIDDGRVVSNFIVQALRGERLTVYGTGAQTRSLCYVDDTVEGLVRLMEHPFFHTAPIFNIGNPNEISVEGIAMEVARAAGRPFAHVERKPLPQDDPRKRKPDISRAVEILGWKPVVGLETGLRRTVDDFRERLNLPAPQ